MADPSPQFQLVGQHSDSFLGAVAALWEIESPIRSLTLSHPRPWPREPGPVPAFFSSLLFHFSVGFFLSTVPLSLLFQRASPLRTETDASPTPVVYDLTKLNLADYLPVELPPGPGGTPGSGSSNEPVIRGTTAQDPRVTIVSNPPEPDNHRQTIVQPVSSADLKIPTDIPLPNLVVADPGSAPKIASKPAPSTPQNEPAPAEKPAVITVAPAVPEITLPAMVPAVSPSQLDAHAPLPPATQAPQPAKFVPLAPATATSMVAPVARSATATPSPRPPTTTARSDSMAETASENKLVSLSVEPVPKRDLLTLPPANRQGVFSVTPLDVRPGSVGGLPAGQAHGGRRGNGAGNDASVASGKESGGGGGPGAAESIAVASIKGDAPASAGSAGGSLPPLSPERLVYPVDIAALRLHRSGLVVSAGPGGGGGLPVYGVLHGQRIYTIYLSMPGKSWILQFCAVSDDPPPSQASQIEIHMEAPLVPPAAINQFDFHRPPLPESNQDRMIILHGIIGQDGSVSNLQVLQAAAPLSDQAAAAAFARWKFTPALRAGRPVAVEVLVGIPAVVPGAQ